uniref:Uncharacterized protein n=1 Tax=Mesocestoides corti TaxID=53468 RepID=A0A5K3FZK5_MESCO
MPPHSPVVAYSPAIYLSFSATEIALGCVTSLSNNNYAYNPFINRNAQLACSRTDFRCSRQFWHYSTITTTTYELQDHHRKLTGNDNPLALCQPQPQPPPPPPPLPPLPMLP